MYRKVSLSEAFFFYLSLQGNKPIKQLAAPDHRRDVVGNAKADWRPKENSVADELKL